MSTRFLLFSAGGVGGNFGEDRGGRGSGGGGGLSMNSKQERRLGSEKWSEESHIFQYFFFI